MQYENNLRFAKKQRKQNVLFYTTSAASNPCVSFMVNMILRRTDFGVNNSIVTSIMPLTAPAREKTFIYKHWSQTFIYPCISLCLFIGLHRSKRHSESVKFGNWSWSLDSLPSRSGEKHSTTSRVSPYTSFVL